MNGSRLGIVVGALALSCVGAEGRASDLTGLTSIGSIVVTAASDTIPEAEVRLIVEQRLERAGLTVDGNPGSTLIVNVTADRNRSDTAPCQFGNFRVMVTLREVVTVQRAPERSFEAITWSRSGSVWRFSTMPVTACSGFNSASRSICRSFMMYFFV